MCLGCCRLITGALFDMSQTMQKTKCNPTIQKARYLQHQDPHILTHEVPWRAPVSLHKLQQACVSTAQINQILLSEAPNKQSKHNPIS